MANDRRDTGSRPASANKVHLEYKDQGSRERQQTHSDVVVNLCEVTTAVRRHFKQVVAGRKTENSSTDII